MENKHNKMPIRGWLIPIAIWLWFYAISQSIAAIGKILLELVPSHKFGQVTGRGTLGDTVLATALAIVQVLLLVLFLKRKRVFVPLFFTFLILGIVLNIAVWSHDFSSLVGLIGNCIIHLALAVYILGSKRARNTFIR